MIRFYSILLLISFQALSQSLDLKWMREFASPAAVLSPAFATALADQGVAIAGWQQRSWDPWSALFVLAIDSTGNVLWQDSIEGLGSGYELYIRGLTATPQGDVIVTGEFAGSLRCAGTMVTDSGHAHYSTFLARFSNGALSSFSVVYGLGATTLGSDSQGNLLLTMETYSGGHGLGSSWATHGTHDLIVCKISSSNTLLWSKQISGYVHGRLLGARPGDGVILFGNFSDSLNFDSLHFLPKHNGPWGSDLFMLYISVNGNITNAQISPTGFMMIPSQLIFHNDQLILTEPVCGNHECGVAYQKTDSSTASLWYTGFPNPGQLGYGDYYGVDHIATVDTLGFWALGTVHTGYTNYNTTNDYVFTRFDFNGNVVNSDTFAILPGNIAYGYGDIEAVSSGACIYFAGTFRDSIGLYGQSVTSSGNEMFVCRFQQGSLTSSVGELKENGLQLYPNPTTGMLTLVTDESEQSLAIFNALGTRVLTRRLFTGKNEIDLSDQPKGIYLAEVTGAKGKIVKKMAVH
jgi:hypothetical protein